MSKDQLQTTAFHHWRRGTPLSTAVSNTNGSLGGGSSTVPTRYRWIALFAEGDTVFVDKPIVKNPASRTRGESCTTSCFRKATQSPLSSTQLSFRNLQKLYGESGRNGP